MILPRTPHQLIQPRGKVVSGDWTRSLVFLRLEPAFDFASLFVFTSLFVGFASALSGSTDEK